MLFCNRRNLRKIPHTGESLVVADYPMVHPEYDDKTAAKGMEVLKELIRSVRNIRAEVNTPLSKYILLIKRMIKKIDEFLN